jgi:hypothetical protein
MDLQQIAKDWNNSGLLIIPAFLDRSAIAELRICDHVLQEAIEVCFTVTVGGLAFQKVGLGLHDGSSGSGVSCGLCCQREPDC